MTVKKRYIRVRKRNRRIRIVRRRSGRRFEPLYREYKPIISEAANSSKGYVPGQTKEDVRAWMAWCLWVAYIKFREDQGEFRTFWWSIWLNKRAELIRNFNAEKRPLEVVTDWDDLLAKSPIVFPDYFLDVATPPTIVPEEHQLAVGYVETQQPVAPDLTQRIAWALLALGYKEVEIRRALDMSIHDWYAMLDFWRCPAIEYMLKEGYEE